MGTVGIRKFGPLLRLVVAVTVLFLIARHAGPQAILQRLKELDAVYLVGACGLILVDSFVRIWNWQQILQALGVTGPRMYRKLTTSYFSGGFLGTVVPSTAGTDVLRAIFASYLFRGNLAYFSGPIVTLNILGLTAGCCLGLAGAAMLGTLGYPATFLVPSAGFFAAVVLGVAMVHLLLKYRRGVLVGLLRMIGPRWFWLRKIARQFLGGLLVFTRRHVRFAPVFAVAILTQLSRALLWMLLARAAAVQLPLAACLMLAPLTALAALIPMSIAGYGGEQVALVYLAAPFGVSAADAVTMSLSYATLQLLTNLIYGGVAFLRSSDRLRLSAYAAPAADDLLSKAGPGDGTR